MFRSVIVFVAAIYDCIFDAALAMTTALHGKLQRSIRDGAITAEGLREGGSHCQN